MADRSDAGRVLPPPTVRIRPLRWLRENLFSTWYNTLLTLIISALLAFVLRGLLTWALTEASWIVIPPNLKLLLTGFYPAAELWRVWLLLFFVLGLLGVSAGLWGGMIREAAVAIGSALTLLLGILLLANWGERLLLAGLLATLFGGLGLGWLLRARDLSVKLWKRGVLVFWLLLPVIVVLLLGGVPGVGWLTAVPTSQWGGLLLTFMLAIVSIALCFPLGVLLALGRQSALPVIRWMSITYIEIIRGVPLITVLFMASLMLPLFLPSGWRVDQVIRAITAFTLFTAAYIAENVRGGLQSVPTGQSEAARALGLSPVLTTSLIVLPQALRAVIPANVGQFISLFKDTSLVFIVPLMDFLGIALDVIENPKWGGPAREMLLFVALTYWFFTYFMSHMSRRLERVLGVGER
jgi:general L-amino acid transport system permease protein